MTTPTPTIDVERLAREAGARKHTIKDYGSRTYVEDSNYLVTPEALKQYAALVLDEAAMRVEVASYRSRWASACSNSKRVAEPCEYAAIVRALASWNSDQFERKRQPQE